MARTKATAPPIVFLGPSLPRREAEGLMAARYLPPAAQGDVMRACAQHPSAILLIDGIFRDAPTVRHREILWALSQGIAVFGAASMGALRAAELWREGMIGVGLIYRWYRRFPGLPDDAVAVTHTPRALGARPLSPALVDIRRSLAAAERAGEITSRTRRQLEKEAQARPFGLRRLPAEAAGHAVEQKARDARAVLRRVAAHLASGDLPRPVAAPPVLAHGWLDDLADSGLPVPGGM